MRAASSILLAAASTGCLPQFTFDAPHEPAGAKSLFFVMNIETKPKPWVARFPVGPSYAIAVPEGTPVEAHYFGCTLEELGTEPGTKEVGGGAKGQPVTPLGSYKGVADPDGPAWDSIPTATITEDLGIRFNPCPEYRIVETYHLPSQDAPWIVEAQGRLLIGSSDAGVYEITPSGLREVNVEEPITLVHLVHTGERFVALKREGTDSFSDFTTWVGTDLESLSPLSPDGRISGAPNARLFSPSTSTTTLLVYSNHTFRQLSKETWSDPEELPCPGEDCGKDFKDEDSKRLFIQETDAGVSVAGSEFRFVSRFEADASTPIGASERLPDERTTQGLGYHSRLGELASTVGGVYTLGGNGWEPKTMRGDGPLAVGPERFVVVVKPADLVEVWPNGTECATDAIESAIHDILWTARGLLIVSRVRDGGYQVDLLVGSDLLVCSG